MILLNINDLSKNYDHNRTNEISLRKINVRDEISSLKDEIYNIENQTEMIDYLSKAMPFIENFNEDDNNICNEGESTSKY